MAMSDVLKGYVRGERPGRGVSPLAEFVDEFSELERTRDQMLLEFQANCRPPVVLMRGDGKIRVEPAPLTERERVLLTHIEDISVQIIQGRWHKHEARQREAMARQMDEYYVRFRERQVAWKALHAPSSLAPGPLDGVDDGNLNELPEHPADDGGGESADLAVVGADVLGQPVQ